MNVFDMLFFFFKQKTAYEMRISDWSSDVCSSDLLISEAPIGVIRDLLLVRSLDGFSDVLPDAVAKESFAFYGTALSGTPEMQERWKRAVDFTTGNLGEAVGQDYVDRYFPPETKAAMDRLVRNVIAALGERIDKLSWMQPETKGKAQSKLANFTTKIGYPDKWKDYSKLEIRADDLFGDALRSNQFAHDDNIGRLEIGRAHV